MERQLTPCPVRGRSTSTKFGPSTCQNVRTSWAVRVAGVFCHSPCHSATTSSAFTVSLGLNSYPPLAGWAFAFILLFGLVGCAHRPIEELVLADVAVKAAQKVKADSLAPDMYRKAENYFLRAKKDFSEGYFDSCRRYANDARLAAEQAEYRALLKQNQIKTRSTLEDPGGTAGAEPYPQSEGIE